jgi:hypothetical protein
MIQASCKEEGCQNGIWGCGIAGNRSPSLHSGYISYATHEYADVRFVPPLEEAEKMEYSERVEKGFRRL